MKNDFSTEKLISQLNCDVHTFFILRLLLFHDDSYITNSYEISSILIFNAKLQIKLHKIN